MDGKKTTANIALALKTPLPESIDAGMPFSFSVALDWPDGIDKKRATYLIRDGKRTIEDGALPKASDDGGIGFTLTAPEEVGTHRWSLVVKAQDAEGSLPLVVTTVPHATSLAVWDNPSPVVRGATFDVKIGAKCTASCGLANRTVEIRDATGKRIGSGVLGDETWPGTTALYWTTISLKAPRKHGLHAWTVGFSPADMKLAHGEASASFSFVTVAEPAHSVSVTVVNTATKAPVKGAQVRLGYYRAVTNDKGSARLRVAKGRFPLVVTRNGYDVPERTIEVSKDLRIRIGAEKLPEEDPFALWTG